MGTEALIALAAVAISAVGTGVSVAATQQQASAANDAAKFNAKVQENNALAAQQQSEAEALQIRRANRLRAGSARAAYGKAGVDLSAANDVMYDTGAQGELEAMSALYAGSTQASYYNSQAAGSRFGGRQAITAGNLNSTASLISGAGQVAGIAARSSNRNPTFKRSGPTYQNLGS